MEARRRSEGNAGGGGSKGGREEREVRQRESHTASQRLVSSHNLLSAIVTLASINPSTGHRSSSPAPPARAPSLQSLSAIPSPAWLLS